ncbi:TRAP transporter small permease subunit [Acuticoccus sp. M5D2P5]|uniref:TRAP transporter small permease n=1 Tax=Acuticoccus kalidii TaxID=2910977 RepID=UPI001F2F18A6|nr:TRAP transporter small permease subunit [Acuticoccus kalidii]MCF3932353.1 TRAP transporter small permease subunit [Acuticoccus kalidii]
MVIDLILGLLLLAIVAITLGATGNRYLLGGALPWAEDLNMLLWVWMIQIAALRAVHIRVDFVVKLFPPRLRAAWSVVLALISLAVLFFVTRSAIGMVTFTASDFYISLPGLSEKWVYVPVVIVGPLWALRIVIDTIDGLKEEGLAA